MTNENIRNGNKKYIDRMLVWMIYLNDVKDGGTEFLYQNHKVDAEQVLAYIGQLASER